MSQHTFHQPLNAGFTLMELTIGLASFGIIGAILVMLFSAGLKSVNYSLFQTLMLTSARQAFEGSDTLHGMVWQARQAASLNDLAASTLDLNTPAGSLVQYQISNQSLINVQQGIQKTQAVKVVALSVNYYAMNSQGTIVQSTTAASATMVTTSIQIQGPKFQPHYFFTGAELRNRSQ